MATCEYSTSCCFLNNVAVNLPTTCIYVREEYCEGNFRLCARFKAAKSVGIDNVPDNLFPFGIKRPNCFYGM
jgi:hypothetical protein